MAEEEKNTTMPAAKAEQAQDKSKKTVKASSSKRRPKKGEPIFAESKRKTSVARASASAGRGRITINKKDIR